MQGWCVEYDRLAPLVADLQIDMNRLIALEILSKLQLAKLNLKNLHINRLHFTDLHKIGVQLTIEVKNQEEEKAVGTELGSKENKATEEATRKIGEDDDLIVCDKTLDHRGVLTAGPLQN